MHPTIHSRAPLRLGISGGGTDIKSYSDQYSGCVLNVTIDRYAYASIKLLDGNLVKFIASDLEITETYHTNQIQHNQLKLHSHVYLKMISRFNQNTPIAMELSTYCDAPIGSGLGSSSAIVVALIKAFDELLHLSLSEYEIAKLAVEIERQDCNLAGGQQDQYAAAFGGLNFIEFELDNVFVTPLRLKPWIINELESSIIMFYTGVSRESAKIIQDQNTGIQQHNTNTLQALDQLKIETRSLTKSILLGDFTAITNSLNKTWLCKKATASSVSNTYIEQIFESAISAGASAGKISGAGGGGFMWFLTSIENRWSVIKSLEQHQGQISTVHFTKHGVQSWKI